MRKKFTYHYIVAWSEGDKQGWQSNFRVYADRSPAEDFFEELNLRSDCWEAYLTEIKASVT